MVHPVEEALQRADAMVENGQAARAISSLEMVLFRFPEDPRLVVRLSELYAADGERETAASYYFQALRLDPSDEELQERMSTLLGDLKEEVEKLSGGIKGLPALRRRRSPEMPRIRLDDFEVSEEVLKLVPRDLVARFRVVPVAKDGETLLLATAHPENRRAVHEVSLVTQLSVSYAVASEADITTALKRFYGLPGDPKKKKR